MIVKKRHYVETILDIIVPAFLFGVLVALRFGVDELGPEDEDANIPGNYDLFNNIKGKDDKQDRQIFSTEGCSTILNLATLSSLKYARSLFSKKKKSNLPAFFHLINLKSTLLTCPYCPGWIDFPFYLFIQAYLHVYIFR